tara:strand:- start:18 stop:200 length:183 start_codon:yes stop_codon:yes gene_type:complete
LEKENRVLVEIMGEHPSDRWNLLVPKEKARLGEIVLIKKEDGTIVPYGVISILEPRKEQT